MQSTNKFPQFFPTVPIFLPIDDKFCVFNYFVEDGYDCDREINAKKVVVDWLDNDDLEVELIYSYLDWCVYLDWDEQKIFITNQEEGWESERINFTLFCVDWFVGTTSHHDTENVAIHVAQIFIAARVSVIPCPGQQKLTLVY